MTKQQWLASGVLVDPEDEHILDKYDWKLEKSQCRLTCRVGKGRTGVTLHLATQIIHPPPGMEVDHINRNRLDNRKANLRLVTHKQNTQNRGVPKNNTTGFKGVTFNKNNAKYQAQIESDGLKHFLGYFDDPKEAAKVYDHAAKNLHGEFATTNKI